MTIDATFWVAISFFIFVGLLIYFKIPKKIQDSLDENILNIKNQIDNAEKLKEEANEEFHKLTENRKKSAEEKIRQMKEQAFNDMKNASVKIAIDSVTRLLKNSLDKSKLDKIYSQSIEETKLALKKKSS